MYPTFDVYKIILNLVTKTTTFKNINKSINEHLVPNNKDIKLVFIRFVNAIVIHNMIKKKLKNKTYDDMNKYSLFEQLNKINHQSQTALNLIFLRNPYQKNQCFETVFTIDNFNINYFIQTINDKEYVELYDTFRLFN